MKNVCKRACCVSAASARNTRHDLSKMGQLLTEPVREKHTSKMDTPKYTVGLSSMQGWRVSMEDAHTVLPTLPEDEAPVASFFGVYDGHGGTKVADFVSKNLHRYLVKSKEYQAGKIKNALEFSFLDLDNQMSKNKDINEDMSGSTAIVIVIKNNTLYCANVGDSRAVAYVNGGTVSLSEDHKPTLPGERSRILEAGGWVEQERVNGSLALSRAFGDFQFKADPLKPPEKQIVSPFPDVVTKHLSTDWKFLIIACDGIWECLTNEEVTNFIKVRLDEGMQPDTICEQLMDKCLAPTTENCGPGCDNMTVIIIVFKWK
ncbi:unnamed protein product [Nezara viridula]|uniref:protein-serine/threonine phosphatase n=1 Tax=Nezara viridula TaxID=85310 RepID=A0A9P0MTJ6_NEZVI|nr:unnamed protein product [Nezara viridula]